MVTEEATATSGKKNECVSPSVVSNSGDPGSKTNMLCVCATIMLPGSPQCIGALCHTQHGIPEAFALYCSSKGSQVCADRTGVEANVSVTLKTI